MRFQSQLVTIAPFRIQGFPVVFSRRPPAWPALRTLGRTLAVVLMVTAGSAGALIPFGDVEARSRAGRTVDGSVGLSQLPAQAQTTYRLILSGGPFPNRKDGSVFGNFERVLPAAPRGFYREYTVATPGAHDRGARRIVCGGPAPTRPAACYYSADHYATFRRIAT